MRSASVAACLLAAFAASCSELEPEVPAATVERTDVVSARIAELEAQVEGGSLDGALPVDIFAAIRTQPVTPLQAQQPDAAARSDATSADEVDDESTATHVVEAPLSDGDLDGLISMLTTSSGRMRNVPLAEAEQYGAALVPQLAAVLGDEARAGEERAAAAELLAATKTSAAGEALIRTAERSSEAWLRSTCVFRLAELEDDRFVLRLLLRLKYEKDPEAFVWIAHALAQLGNYAGLESLRSLAWNAQDEGVRERARAEFARTAEAVGVDSGDEVLRRWYAADAAALPPREPSAALRLNVWRALSNLSSEHFQLRGVDDARYALANLGHWAAPEIAQALADRDFHVRLHGAQVLERMGLRAHGALDQLVAALDDPELAPQALASLGSLGPDAFEQVAARVHRDQPFEQRVAALRALTRVDPERARPIFISIFRDTREAHELRLRSAEGLVAQRGELEFAALLRDELADELGDCTTAENALTAWLAKRAEEDPDAFQALHEEWTAAGRASEGIPSTEKARALREQRHGLLTAAWDRLTDPAPTTAPEHAGESAN